MIAGTFFNKSPRLDRRGDFFCLNSILGAATNCGFSALMRGAIRFGIIAKSAVTGECSMKWGYPEETQFAIV